ncbi:MAG: 6-phosphogluconolactonase [Anaerolineales bacterium]|nr:6-phosphogluconolactonase [Anaerolineales bacterium]
MSTPRILTVPTPIKWAQTAADLIIEQARLAFQARSSWSFVLSGGSTPKPVYLALAARKEQIDWAKTYIFWGDERCVPPDDPDSNYRTAREAFLDQIPIPAQNIFRILGEISPQAAAQDYQGTLDAHFYKTERRFDTLLLGLGEDGHTASLFPGTPALAENKKLVVPNTNPHNNTDRVTLTYPAINSARSIIFLVSGENKAAIVADVIQNPTSPPDYPAKKVTGTDSAPIWVLDQAAASRLNT